MLAKTPTARAHATGASRSLKLTITEIDTFLAGASLTPPPGPLRDNLHDKLAELAQKWYKKGFNRGHRESYADFSRKGKVSKTINASVGREFFLGKRSAVKLQSSIPKKEL